MQWCCTRSYFSLVDAELFHSLHGMGPGSGTHLSQCTVLNCSVFVSHVRGDKSVVQVDYTTDLDIIQPTISHLFCERTRSSVYYGNLTSDFFCVCEWIASCAGTCKCKFCDNLKMLTLISSNLMDWVSK